MTEVPTQFQRLTAEVDGWLELRCPEKALDRLQPLLDHPAARATGLALRVRAYVEQARYQDALADLAELRDTDSDPEWLDLTEAWCRKRTGELPAAIACMQRLLARNPRSAIGHFNLGCYLALAGERERALDEVTLACGMDSDYRAFAATEKDLDSLAKDPRFLALLQPPGGIEEPEDEEGEGEP